MFPPLSRTRNFRDWFSPLDGCPRCGYAYEREPGYFLLAIWAVNYGLGSVLGISIYLIIELTWRLPLTQLVPAVVLPVALFNFFFARHAKALFLAFDHFFDPHARGGGDDGGNRRVEPPAPVLPASPGLNPEGLRKEEPAVLVRH
jgi:uncharacterized protein (DUF983 family)